MPKRGSGEQPRAIAPRDGGWTVAKRKLFLEVLAATCSVHKACAAAERSIGGLYALRRRDSEFARLWQEALTIGMDRLEDELFANALPSTPSLDASDRKGPDGEAPDGDPSPAGPTTAFDARAALELLKYRRSLDAGGFCPRKGGWPTQEEVDTALLARFNALAERLARGDRT